MSVEIINKKEAPTAVYIEIKTDYGLQTQLNFTKPVTDEDIMDEIKKIYEANKPEKQKELKIKKGDKVKI